ncbi:type IV secretion system protein [Citrobacter sp. JGM124]|uniref:virB8 family protein n=1 Tax=Citrobacter sp. JGM124 TaxID=2799789 RepID=UPI001BACDCB8|nr:type IV secretion system protein [Citrobacter sp. JGM124]MBS0847038.1 type IV secretion system protein [Citrobacter sp. JGM124]
MSELPKILNTSRSFEKVMLTRDAQAKKLAGIIAAAATLLALLSMMAVIVMLPLKHTEVALYTVDSHSGRAEYVTRIKEKDIASEEAMAKAFAAHYAKLREEYNYFALQNNYDTVQLFNSGQVNADYLAGFAGPDAPDKVYQNAANLVEIEVISNLISLATAPDKLATLRLKKTIRHIVDGATRVEFWNIRLTYRYLPHQALTEAQRESNPLGFTVTSYQRDKELRKE